MTATALRTKVYEYRGFWQFVIFCLVCAIFWWVAIPWIAGPPIPETVVSYNVWTPANLREVNNFSHSFDSGGLWTSKEGLTLPVIRKSLRDYKALENQFSLHYLNWRRGMAGFDLTYIAKNPSTTHLTVARDSIEDKEPISPSKWHGYSVRSGSWIWDKGKITIVYENGLSNPLCVLYMLGFVLGLAISFAFRIFWKKV